MDDFEPENVAKQVKPLKELLDLRTRLADLRGSLQGNDKLEELLLDAVGNTEKLDKLKGEMGTKEEAPMADPAATKQAASGSSRDHGGEGSARSDCRAGTVRRRSHGPGARQEPGQGVRRPGARRLHDRGQGRRDDDQRAHRADRSPALASS